MFSLKMLKIENLRGHRYGAKAMAYYATDPGSIPDKSVNSFLLLRFGSQFKLLVPKFSVGEGFSDLTSPVKIRSLEQDINTASL